MRLNRFNIETKKAFKIKCLRFLNTLAMVLFRIVQLVHDLLESYQGCSLINAITAKQRAVKL